jgi:hypothetical protein
MDLAFDQTSFGNRWSLAAGIAGIGLRPVSLVSQNRQLLFRRKVGRIVTQRGRLEAIYGRWWPHWGSMLQVQWDTRARALQQDRCELFYHQPTAAPGFLTLAYVHSGPRTSLGTFYAATLVLDEIARLKDSLAIVAHVTNLRISDRLLERWGWEAHCPHWSGRHFIKRLYGKHPVIAAAWRNRLSLD